MKYMGSKNRHAKELLSIILAGRRPGQWYVEPFVGGANMIDRVAGPRIGSDVHPQLIAMWQAVASGWLPPSDISESEYKAAQAQRKIDALTGFIGFPCSYAAKWFGGYARGLATDGSPRNYADEAFRAIAKQAPALYGVDFRHGPYTDLDIPSASIIYCDPPYAGTTKYAAGSFDHASFWQWCDARHDEGHTVFVSEYTAPEHWRCIWSKAVNNTLAKNTGAKRGVEKLFARIELKQDTMEIF